MQEPNHQATITELRSRQLLEPIKLANQKWADEVAPEVSICSITYNHGPFIRDCLEGFLSQETTFPVEILIHDDASTDDTAKIIREFENRFPKLIKPIYQSENQYSRGISPNRKFNYPRARGLYLALCEGDDYWTDPTKLQRHKEFLDKNPEYVMVADNSIWKEVEDSTQRLFSELPGRDVGILELLEKRQFATASVLYRNLKEELVTSNTHPWFHLSRLGKIRYFSHVSSVYRRHAGGVTASDKVNWAKQMIDWNNRMRANHPEVGEEVFKNRDLRVIKSALLDLLSKQRYQDLFVALDELPACSSNSQSYLPELHTYLSEQFRKRDIRLHKLENQFLLRMLRFIRDMPRSVTRTLQR